MIRLLFMLILLSPGPSWAMLEFGGGVSAGGGGGGATWPNEPAGFTTLTDHPFTAQNAPSGWTVNDSSGEIVSDADAPVSPNSVLRNYRDASSNHGSAFYYTFTPTVSEFFMGFAVKYSPLHYGWFNWYQKTILIDNAGQHMYLWATQENTDTAMSFHLMDECGRSWCSTHLTSGAGTAFINNVSDPIVPNNVWHKVEIYYKGSTGTTSQNGILKMWIDNAAVLNVSTANLNNAVGDIWISNIWDSINTALPQEEWLRYDHVHISAP